MSNRLLEISYRTPPIAWGYDLLATLVFAPVGGLNRLRHEALEHLRVARGTRVLELGCGSGGVTRRLVDLGAEVTAVDWSLPMLRKAAKRAPSARFAHAELTSYDAPLGEFELVFFSFVLHELNEESRKRALAVASRALSTQGRIAIVDHALPEQGFIPRALSRFVHGFEPASSRSWLLDGAAERALHTTGFEPETRRPLASGMAFLLEGKKTIGEKSSLSS